MTNAEKIFIELDDEINFVLEKVRAASSSRVILVVPNASNLGSSITSLKVLTKAIANDSSKVVVIATEDEFTKRLATKSNLLAVNNPGEITQETWDKSLEMKEELSSQLERKKKMLLDRRNEKLSSEYKIVDEKKNALLEKAKEEQTQPSGTETDEVKPLRPTSRITAKVVTVGAVKFLSAGDVLANEQLLNELIAPRKEDVEVNEDKSSQSLKSPTAEEEPSNKGEDNEEGKEKSSFERRRSIVGLDLSHSTPAKRPVRGATQAAPSPIIEAKEKVTKVVQDVMNDPKKKKIAIGTAAALVFLFLVTPVFSASATITVNLKKDNVSINQEIKADPKVQGVNAQTFEIPAESRSSEDTASESGSSTGSATKGDKAQGTVSVLNPTDTTISIPAGTKLNIDSSGLGYITSAAGAIEKGKSADLGIVAENSGDNYNAPDGRTFSYQGMPAGVIIKNFRPITGGTSKKVTVVSQEDLDAVKDIVKKRVESSALTKLESLTATDEIILKESTSSEILEEGSTKKAGDEANNFDVSVRAKVSALFVKKADIEAIATEIAKATKPTEGDAEIKIAVFPQITNVTFANGVAKFTISSQASARAKLTEDDIKSNVSGKSIGEADQYLKDLPEVESYKIDYSPAFLPGFLKKVPSSPTIKIAK